MRNPLSRRRHGGGGGLSKTDLLCVATLVVVFAAAAFHFFLVPLFVGGDNPSSLSYTENSIKSPAIASTTTGGRLRGGVEQEPAVDWSEQTSAKTVAKQSRIQQIAESASSLDNNSRDESDRDDLVLVLTLSDGLGRLLIRPRPDLSAESVKYVHQLAALDSIICERCQFYRAEKPGILQGILESSSAGVAVASVRRGPCPPGAQDVPNHCPAWDKECACHGPLMTRGMVAWAGGKTGPDFFINAYERPVDIWGTQHTVWGELLSASWPVVDQIWTLPTKHEKSSAMTFLETPLSFTVSLEKRNNTTDTSLL